MWASMSVFCVLSIFGQTFGTASKTLILRENLCSEFTFLCWTLHQKDFNQSENQLSNWTASQILLQWLRQLSFPLRATACSCKSGQHILISCSHMWELKPGTFFVSNKGQRSPVLTSGWGRVPFWGAWACAYGVLVWTVACMHICNRVSSCLCALQGYTQKCVCAPV